MAALVCIVYSLSVQVYRIGCVFVESGGSLSDCVNYITETRKTVLINRYLANIDVYYDLETVCNQFIDGNRCFNCKKKLRKMSNEIILGTEDFLKIEQCQEAFEIISKQVSLNQFKICLLYLIKCNSDTTTNHSETNRKCASIKFSTQLCCIKVKKENQAKRHERRKENTKTHFEVNWRI